MYIYNKFRVLLFLLFFFIFILYHPRLTFAEDIFAWTATESPEDTQGLGSAFAFAYNNKIFIIGGGGTTVSPISISATILPNGSLTNWVKTENQLAAIWHSGVLFKDKVYILGGANESVINTGSVQMGTIDVSNEISWSQQTSLPMTLGLGGTFIYNNRIYYAGGSTLGENSSLAQSTIYKADINLTSGNLGNWTIAGNLPQPMFGFNIIESNGEIFVFGGKNTSNNYLSDVKKATIDKNSGNINQWVNQKPLPKPVYRNGIVKFKDKLISVGGYNIDQNFNLFNQVSISQIDQSNNISDWLEGNQTLPSPNCCMALATFNDVIYLIGGWINMYTNQIYFTLPNSIQSPLPTPIIPIISVPDLKQYSIPWKDKVYGFTDKTIKQFGCALTSAAMVLNYHGHNILPDELNTWLRGESDGYIRNGLLNWLAVSRHTKLNDTLLTPTLEYKRLNPTNDNLDNELNNNRPAILKENGHFVVGTGKLSSGIYTINDPAYETRTTLEPYGNSFLSINSFTPTHSDLSYMMFTADSDIVLQIVDDFGNIIPTINYVEDPISDPNDPSNISGEPLSILLLEKPASGKYKLKITGPNGNYNLDSYLYTTSGQITKNSFEGNLLENDTDIYDISFNSEHSITIDTTLPPTPTNTIPTNNSYSTTKNFTFYWDAVVDDRSPVTYEWESSYSTNTKTDGSFANRLAFHKLDNPSVYSPGTPDNVYYWHVRATDKAGNSSPWSETWKITVDSTKPTIPSGLSFTQTNGTTLGCGIYTNQYTIVAKWLASVDTNFSHYEYRSFNPTNGWVWNAGSVGNTLSRTGSFTVGQGTYGFAVRGVDKAGNYSNWTSENIDGSCKITYDYIAPSVPTGIYYKDTDNDKNIFCNSYTNTKHLDVYWDKNPEIDFDHYEYISYNADGSTGPIRTFTSNYFNASWWTIPKEGTYGVQINAVDKAGNKSEWYGGSQNVQNSCKYMADWTAPTANWINPTNNATVSGTVLLDVIASDNLSGVESIVYGFRKDNSVDEFQITSSNWDTSQLDLDIYTLRATVKDNAGNILITDQPVQVSAIISNIISNTPSTDSAVITWTTDKPTKSRVVYDIVPHATLGNASSYGYTFSTNTQDISPKTNSHSITINVLSANTTYYYRVISEGSPIAISEQKEFTTLSNAGAPSGTTESSGTSTSASIVLGTNTTPLRS